MRTQLQLHPRCVHRGSKISLPLVSRTRARPHPHTRNTGYKHGGKGGHCSISQQQEAEEEEEEDEELSAAAARRAAVAEGLTLDRSERAASGFRGVYHSGQKFIAKTTDGGNRIEEAELPPRNMYVSYSTPFHLRVLISPAR